MRRLRVILTVLAAATALLLATPVFAQWPTTCVDLNDIVEQHLGRTNNVGIYQRVFGDQAEAACQGDHREDVRGVFGWAFDLASPAAQPAVAGSSLPLVDDALYAVVWRGRTAQVRRLVAAGHNVNTRDSDNDPLIHSAIWRNHEEIVRILADAGANVNALDSDGDPMIHDAIWRVHTNVVQILVDAGADVNARESNGDPLIFEPIFRGAKDILRILIDAGADVTATDSRGRTPLGYALSRYGEGSDFVRIIREALAAGPVLGWPTTCVDLNDIVENHLGNDQNVGIYQKVFGAQAEAGCQNDHREDVRGVFAWAF